mmetsp:Transcript_161286/g.297476  ORF Transcript_161286/g.297476 Transcript_161286/m.297476 type:complete len:167 (-) Transcript_161286:39-539(-)
MLLLLGLAHGSCPCLLCVLASFMVLPTPEAVALETAGASRMFTASGVSDVHGKVLPEAETSTGVSRLMREESRPQMVELRARHGSGNGLSQAQISQIQELNRRGGAGTKALNTFAMSTGIFSSSPTFSLLIMLVETPGVRIAFWAFALFCGLCCCSPWSGDAMCAG